MADAGTLLFIPQSWPFPDAAEDTFIAPELPHLAEAFGRVIVAPLQGGPNGAAAQLGPRCQFDPGLLDSLTRRTGLGSLLGHAWHADAAWDLGGTGLGARFARARMMAAAARIRRALVPLIDAYRPTLTYTYWFHAATIAACQLGPRTATRAHGYDLYEDRHPQGFQPLRRWTLGRLELIACVSDHGRRHLAERYPSDAERCEVHRLGVACDGLASTWDEERLTLVSCSAAVALKRLPRIAEIAHHAARISQRQVHWLHLGDGPELGALRERVRSLAHARLTCELPGAVPANEVRQRLRCARPLLFLNQSSSEGAPVGVMEALSCGIPICAGAVGGLPELVDADNGLLHGADVSPEAIAMAIVALANDPARHCRLAAGARRSWQRMCDPAVNHARFAARLRMIAAGTDPPRSSQAAAGRA